MYYDRDGIVDHVITMAWELEHEDEWDSSITPTVVQMDRMVLGSGNAGH
jgi:hypothetical protein